MANLESQSALKSIFTGLNVGNIVKQLIKLLNAHWSDTDEGTERFDPLPNPRRFLVVSPEWLPKILHRHIDCGEPGVAV